MVRASEEPLSFFPAPNRKTSKEPVLFSYSLRFPSKSFLTPLLTALGIMPLTNVGDPDMMLRFLGP